MRGSVISKFPSKDDRFKVHERRLLHPQALSPSFLVLHAKKSWERGLRDEAKRTGIMVSYVVTSKLYFKSGWRIIYRRRRYNVMPTFVVGGDVWVLSSVSKR